MTAIRLRRVTPEQLPSLARPAVDAETETAVRPIIEDVRRRGEAALVEQARRFGDLAPDESPYRTTDELARALDSLGEDERGLLLRTAARIRSFAEAQKATLSALDIPVSGGRAGHMLAPVAAAGCYAPGGRFPLPSSVLMTAVVARAAGVSSVWVASPRPTAHTLAAAAAAGADGLLAVGGAQAIAALAYGAEPVPPSDVVCGPGNRFVTAAKKLVAGDCAIDMLAGPSELVVLADHTADAETIAADLLAQAEHDPEARPILVTPDATLADAVDAALARQLATLPTRPTAEPALRGGFCVRVRDLDEGARVCDKLAPEHLQVMTADADTVAARCRHYGALFIGAQSAEAAGDYGAGPNHVLPTGGTARFAGGLSVFNFLRVRTWLRLDDGPEAQTLLRDAAALARLEGLEGHARAAEKRLR
ncbi:MAG: histidinol dehydrogenase [Myxococcales bacterium]|nr:MAG: histidinol dehydrogenase [Myxococcales bacterium]